jgi:hypothetical protein
MYVYVCMHIYICIGDVNAHNKLQPYICVYVCMCIYICIGDVNAHNTYNSTPLHEAAYY